LDIHNPNPRDLLKDIHNPNPREFYPLAYLDIHNPNHRVVP